MRPGHIFFSSLQVYFKNLHFCSGKVISNLSSGKYQISSFRELHSNFFLFFSFQRRMCGGFYRSRYKFYKKIPFYVRLWEYEILNKWEMETAHSFPAEFREPLHTTYQDPRATNKTRSSAGVLQNIEIICSLNIYI